MNAIANTSMRWADLFAEAREAAAFYWKGHRWEPSSFRSDDEILINGFVNADTIWMRRSPHAGKEHLRVEGVTRRREVTIKYSCLPPHEGRQPSDRRESRLLKLLAHALLHEYVHCAQTASSPSVIDSLAPQLGLSPYPFLKASLSPCHRRELIDDGATQFQIAYLFSPLEIEAWAVSLACLNSQLKSSSANALLQFVGLTDISSKTLSRLYPKWSASAEAHGLQLPQLR